MKHDDSPRWSRARGLRAIRDALHRLFPGAWILRCIVPGLSGGWVGYRVVSPETRVTLAFSQSLLDDLTRGDEPTRCDDVLREAGVFEATGPDSSRLLLVRPRRSNAFLAKLHRGFRVSPLTPSTLLQFSRRTTAPVEMGSPESPYGVGFDPPQIQPI
jgi:hypothetical protein